jgi:L-aminopeptidase/D-esterase-like protein
MIEGFRVGHYTDLENVTDCTVVLAPPEGAIGGADVRGPAPGTLGTDTLHTGRAIERAHAVVLSGGSAFGLDTVAGVMRFLEEREIGFEVGAVRVPIVAGAILFDLTIGNPKVRPNAENSYAACLGASTKVAEGSVGAGTGATVGKMQGIEFATKGGIGYSERALTKGISVGALVAVNAVGDVIDPSNGQIVGGARNAEGGWLDSSAYVLGMDRPADLSEQNTTIGVVMTNATLTVEQANLVAMMSHDGIARATRPSHTFFDGDTLFVLASGARGAGDLTMVGHAAALCVADAIVRGVKQARSLGRVRTYDGKIA